MPKDYYQTLGISKTASPDEIKKAFRKLAHQYHPDKKGGNEAKFKEINEAYQVLSDEDKRKKYDQFGSAAFSGNAGAGAGMNWEDIMRQSGFSGFGDFSAKGGPTSGWDFDDLGDVLGGMFGFGGRGGSRRGRRSNRGADMEIEISLDFIEAVFGVEKIIRLEREVKCEHCHGNGAEPGTAIKPCGRCNGGGEIIHTQTTILGSFQSRIVCPDCNGEGKKATSACRECNGAGHLRTKSEVKIRIPSGIDDGQAVRLSGLGNAGVRGGASGDLYVHVRVKPHKKFSRNGNDILSDETISISQAVLGDDILVETVHGPVKLKIPSGTESGKVFKLANRGIPSSQSGQGDHLVKIEVKIPSKLSRKERELFEQLRKAEKGEKSWF